MSVSNPAFLHKKWCLHKSFSYQFLFITYVITFSLHFILSCLLNTIYEMCICWNILLFFLKILFSTAKQGYIRFGPFVCLSVCAPLLAEPFYIWPWFFAGVLTLTPTRMGLKVKVIIGQRSRSNVKNHIWTSLRIAFCLALGSGS